MSTESEKQTGIIRDVRVGCDDRFGKACISFTVYTSPGSAFGWMVRFPEAAELIEKSGVTDVKELNGQPCYWHDEGAICRFDGLWGK